MEAMLVGVSASDPIVLAGVTLVVVGAALAAAVVPARRASQVDPAVVLRAE